MTAIKRKIDGKWHLMIGDEYTLCGLTFDYDFDPNGTGERNYDALDPKNEKPCEKVREITCPTCVHRIRTVRSLK